MRILIFTVISADQGRNFEHFHLQHHIYTAILNGEPITGVRFKYDYDLESYLLKHMWD